MTGLWTRLGNSRTTYGPVTRIVHWGMALLILALIAMGLLMQRLPDGDPAAVERKFALYSLHKTMGLIVLGLALLRCLWTALWPRPVLLNAGHRLEAFVARTVHWLLYGLILVVPLTGWLHHAATEGLAPIHWPFPQGLPLVPASDRLAALFGSAHHMATLVLMAVLLLHTGGALKHSLIDRDATLRRMVSGLPRPAAARPDGGDEAVGAVGAAGAADHGAANGRAGGRWVERVLPAGVAALCLLCLGVAVALTHSGEAGRDLVSGSGLDSGPGALAGADIWRVDPAASRLEIEVDVAGDPVIGQFGAWQADIRFDPAALDEARVAVDIAVASLSLGGVGAQALAPDYLDAATWPSSRFVAEQFLRRPAGGFVARGTLSLAGQTRAVDFPFDLEIENGRAFMTGEARLNRLDFGIGPDSGPAGTTVTVRVQLEATG